MKNLASQNPKTDFLSQKITLSTHKLYYFFFFFISTAHYTTKAQSSSIDSSKAAELYQQIVQQTDCTGNLSANDFYDLLSSYFPKLATIVTPSSSSSFSRNTTAPTQDTIYIYQTKIIQADTVFVDTTAQSTSPTTTVLRDTVLMYQEMPSADEVKAAKEILQRIIEDKDLTELIQETVSTMSAKEINDFRKEIAEDVRDMNQQLKKERSKRIALELGAKRARIKKAKEERKKARRERKEARDTMSKEEKKELIKAKMALLAEETGKALKVGGIAVGAAAGTGVAAAGASLAAIGWILAKGIIAIGKGIINTAKAIWNWIDAHFYIKIDLSCAEQRKIKKHKKTMAVLKKKRKAKPYKGYCPGW